MNSLRRFSSWIAISINRFFTPTLAELRRQQRDDLDSASHSISSATGKAAAVLAFAGVMLVFREPRYRPDFDVVMNGLLPVQTGSNSIAEPGSWRETIYDPANLRLCELIYWSVWQLLIYMLLPMLFVVVVLRERLTDYGIKLRGFLYCWWAYVGMYAVLLPFVLWMSGNEAFLLKYPFFKPTDVAGELDGKYWSRFWIWEAFYALQFVTLEFFFRGFLLHGTKRALGIGSVFVMMIPYCMIHFGKPLPETLGALVAGLVLGFMSLKTRSIWLGAISHIAVALTMDFAALSHRD